jgi:hypothetical protein
MSYLNVEQLCVVVRAPTFPSLEHMWCFDGHSRNEGLRRRRRRA